MNHLKEQIRNIAQSHPSIPSDLQFGPTSENDVRDVEEKIGNVFPNSYRAYLLEFAGGMMLNYEMCGIPTEKSGISDSDGNSIRSIVDANKGRERDLATGNVFIADDGGDYSFFLDTAKMDSDGECPVVAYGPGAQGSQVAATFVGFLEWLAAGGLVIT